MPDLQLRRFERGHLPLVGSWFTDRDTNRWLGGPQWPRQMLDLDDRPLGEVRGALETGRHRWLAWDRDTPVGYIDCGTYDRWTTRDGSAVTDEIPLPSATIAYLVDPALRRRGYGTAMITALRALPVVEHVALFTGGSSRPTQPQPAACARRASVRCGPRPTGSASSTTPGSGPLRSRRRQRGAGR